LTAAQSLLLSAPQTSMQKLDFAEAVDQLTQENSRYHRDAFFFLREALDHTVKMRKRQLGEGGHVNGPQLCEGIRQLALKQFGPMVPTVFAYWGVERTDDFGAMVWQMIDLGVFGKTDNDTREDFNGIFDFKEAFVDPFLPPMVPAKPQVLGTDEPSSTQAAA
jgi:uncharacterized repeat protein (TIGR04138 family)